MTPTAPNPLASSRAFAPTLPQRMRYLLTHVTAGAEAGAFEVFAIAVGQNLADELARGLNVETDRRLGMIEILRPATPASRMVTRRSARCPTL